MEAINESHEGTTLRLRRIFSDSLAQRFASTVVTADSTVNSFLLLRVADRERTFTVAAHSLVVMTVLRAER